MLGLETASPYKRKVNPPNPVVTKPIAFSW